MADLNETVDQAKDILNLEQKDMNTLPGMLNVLTILTYIGSALGAIGALYSYFTISSSYKLVESMNSRTEGAEGFENKAVQSLMSGSVDLIRKQYENRTLIMILALIGVALCIYGAMQMRNLKKQGYMIYVVGELIPIISYAIFIGFGSLFGGIGMMLTSLISVVFIIMYTTQRKALVN